MKKYKVYRNYVDPVYNISFKVEVFSAATMLEAESYLIRIVSAYGEWYTIE